MHRSLDAVEIKRERIQSDANRTIETVQGESKQAETEIQKLKTDSVQIIETVQEESQKSYNEVMNMARGSLMVFSGIAGAIGGTMGRVFSAVYTTAVSIFTLYKTIAVATATINPVQAAIQFASVILAMMNLGAVAAGQRETSRVLHGVTQSLHGVSMMLGNYSM